MGEIMRSFGTIRDSKKREPVNQTTIKLSIEGWSPDDDDFLFIELKVKYNKEDFV